MNKHCFTLVELLATIVIIAMLAGLATVSYTALMCQTADEVFKRYEDTMHAEAVYKLTMHYNKVVFSGNTARLPINGDSSNPNFLEVDLINNPKDASDKCLDSYVDVTRSNVGTVTTFTYKVCLICSDYNSDGSNCKVYDN
jgi:prepilin-type N-terminal cleavage/methylation domain-containing protein